ncbi:MAG: phosphate-starvation-inducible PsiE family protein [Patescibacteria group bacterium]|nr:phosphate-starvation-inducible PsiE family protein [Patescibacteria group bacterium]
MVKDCDYSQKHGKFMCLLHDTIVLAIKSLAILTVMLIILGVISSMLVIYKVIKDNGFILDGPGFIKIFSEIMLVLIAVEIFQNIAMYIRTDVIPIKLVLATALIAVARKFIIIDASKDGPLYILALAAAVAAIGFSYWLISRHYHKIGEK